MNAVRQRLRSLLPALFVLVLVFALHPGTSHPLAIETAGYPSIYAAVPHQISSAGMPGTGHCATDHVGRIHASEALSCNRDAGDAVWPPLEQTAQSRALTYLPHRPPITT
jgi:hypothetical protein